MHLKHSLLTTVFVLLMTQTYPSVLAGTTYLVKNDISQTLDPNLQINDAFFIAFLEKLSGRFIVSVDGVVIPSNEQVAVTPKDSTCTISFEFEPAQTTQTPSKIRLTGTLKLVVGIATVLNNLGTRIGLIQPNTINNARIYFSYALKPGTTVISLGDILLEQLTAWVANAPDIELDIDGMHII